MDELDKNPDLPLPTVVVPVFNAFECLADCLQALHRCTPDAEVLLIDDASDDERIAPLLQEWVERWPGTRLISLRKNGGFVRSANLGAAETTGDIVLLNSDTLVTRGWLFAMARCLNSADKVASATPWSNNAEIVSWPELCVPAPVPEDAELIARAVRKVREGCYPELPTAVGFCMGITRRSMDLLGLFNEGRFGRGYGEENDFSRRAVKAGFSNLLCEDAYVVHLGGQSFGPLGLKPDDAAMQRLLELHPDYLEVVMDWIKADPLAQRRAAIAAAMAQH